MKIYKVITTYLLVMLIAAVPPLLLVFLGQTGFIVPHFWIMFFYISFLTLLVIAAVLLIQQKNAGFYAQAFLAATTVKILGCLFFVVVFVHKIHVDKVVFAVDFFYIYFFNTAFEVYGLLRNLRNQNLR